MTQQAEPSIWVKKKYIYILECDFFFGLEIK